jgi:hypothetical protein
MKDSGRAEDSPQNQIWQELRSAVRFPLHLPVLILAGGEQREAVTVNISTNGILLRLEDALPAESGLEFLLEVPNDGTYGESTAAIHCVGHVIRSFEQDGFSFIAAVIDDYRFQ